MSAGPVAGLPGSPLMPMGVVTGIGSLPFNDPLDAVDFVATFCPHLPFCPQPPSADLAEDTLAQQLDSSPRGWAWSLDHFVDAALAGAFPHALALKTQVTGPITLAGLLGATGQATVSAKLLAALANWVIDHVSWQLDRSSPQSSRPEHPGTIMSSCSAPSDLEDVVM